MLMKFMMLLFCFTRLHCERGGKKTPHFYCVQFMCVYLWEAERSNVANSVIRLREKRVVCPSVELQQLECTLTDDVTCLVAVRNTNIWCHSIQLFSSRAAL